MLITLLYIAIRELLAKPSLPTKAEAARLNAEASRSV